VVRVVPGGANYLVHHGVLAPRPVQGRWSAREVDAHVAALDGDEAAMTLAGRHWAWPFALRACGCLVGYLVVGALAEPSAYEFALARLVAGQVAAALATVRLRRHARQQAGWLHVVDRERLGTKQRLSQAVSDLQRQTTIHQTLSGVSASGQGEEGIARILHELTGLPVAVEDRFGNLRAWAGPDRPPSSQPQRDSHRRDELLQRAARCGQPLRERDRLMALATDRNEVLGVLALHDPDRRAGRHELLALEHAATMLALELAHQLHVVQLELRLRRDLVNDLVTGTDTDSAVARAEAMGHDLHGPHHVAVLSWQDRPVDDTFAAQVGHAATAIGIPTLLAQHAGLVVLVVHGDPSESGVQRLFTAVRQETGTPAGAIGVSGPCACPAELPRSFHEALRALDVRKRSSLPTGATTFEELGLYRVLGASDDGIASFVRQWLGPLLDYDARHHGELVRTLTQYLDGGGNYDHTAHMLVIHRSTLRYRLRRIREIAGVDLHDPDTRLNLHVATRACRILHS
jgi:sugar diacid utilization regulator